MSAQYFLDFENGGLITGQWIRPGFDAIPDLSPAWRCEDARCLGNSLQKS